jgi:hypothetical protein
LGEWKLWLSVCHPRASPHDRQSTPRAALRLLGDHLQGPTRPVFAYRDKTSAGLGRQIVFLRCLSECAMSRPRTPTAILDAQGAFLEHPDRARENEPETDGKNGLGNAPAYLSDFQKEVWAEVSAQVLPGVAFESDRTAFELLIRLTCKMRTDTINRSEVSSLIALTGRFAMNPADRSKVSVEKSKESKLDKFLQRSATLALPQPVN